MLIRIVRMTFEESKMDQFLEIFNSSKKKIRSFPGCHHLELWRDHDHPNVFVTFSKWKDQESLNNYRNSDLFGDVWVDTKKLFKDKPVAFSSNLFDPVV